MALLPKEKRSPKLLLPADNKTILLAKTFEQGFTQSEIGVWDDCAEKWYLQYNHRLDLKGEFEWHFIYGDAVHETLANWYGSAGFQDQVATLQFPEGTILTSQQEAEKDTWQGILKVQMERYFKHYKDDLVAWKPWAVEQTLEIEFEGIKLLGKLDLGVDDWIDDHKTFGLEDYEGWNFRFQFMFYWWLAQKATGRKIKKFLVNGIKKPQIRQTQKESLADFLNRVRQVHIQEPEKYFIRHWLPYMKNSMEHFEDRVLRPKIERIKLTQSSNSVTIDALVRNQNTHSCVKFGSTCQFLNICKHGYLRDGHSYIRREHKHNELQPCK